MKQLFRDIREAYFYAYYRLREYDEDFCRDFPLLFPFRWNNFSAILVFISLYLFSILLVVFELNGWDSDELPKIYLGIMILATIIIIRIDDDKVYKEMKKKYKNDPKRSVRGWAVFFFCLGVPLSLLVSLVICCLID